MIDRFHVLYVGQIELDNIGRDGTPANERRYSDERLRDFLCHALKRSVARGQRFKRLARNAESGKRGHCLGQSQVDIVEQPLPTIACSGNTGPGLVEALLEVRDRARAARDWASADLVRDRLTAAGVEVRDAPEGTRWELDGSEPAHA